MLKALRAAEEASKIVLVADSTLLSGRFSGGRDFSDGIVVSFTREDRTA